MASQDPVTQTKAVLSRDGELVGWCSKEGAILDLEGNLLAWEPGRHPNHYCFNAA